jgi:hypothetical protein
LLSDRRCYSPAAIGRVLGPAIGVTPIFISPAFAQAASGSAGMSEILMQVAPFGLILVIMPI